MAIMKLIRCSNPKCGKLLCKTFGTVQELEIKCTRCKTINKVSVKPAESDTLPVQPVKRAYTRRQT
jgi:phage FluMu protein Com